MAGNDLTNKTDEELMSLCREGVNEAFELLYLRNRRAVINFAYQMVHNNEDAADVFQDTFKYIFGKIETYEPTAKFSTLLFTVARNLCIDILRKRRRRHFQQLIPEIDIEDRKPGQEERIESREIGERLKDALDQIPESYREVLVLRIIHDKPYEAISEILQCPIGTVKSRIHMGLELLRKMVKQKHIID